MDENKKGKGRERERESLIFSCFTKQNRMTLQPQRKKTELNDTTLKRISALKRHAAVFRIFAAEDNEISSAWKNVIPPLSDVRS